MRSLILIGLGCLLVACHEAAPGRRTAAGPAVVLADSVVLSESGANFVAQLGGVAEDGRGRYLVTDMAQDRVVRFGSDGRWMDVIGRKGAGPGEFLGPTAAVPLASGFLVGDDQLRRLTIFDDSGRRVREVASPGIVRNVVRRNGDIWFGGVDAASETGIARWNGDTSFRRIFPFPDSYRESPPLRGIYTIVALDVWGDTVLAAYSGSNAVAMMDTAGRELARYEVPVSRRKGVAPEQLRKLSDPATPFPEMFSALSGLFQLHRLSSGQVALLHMDQRLDGSAIQSEAFISLLSADRKRACVDGSVPLHGGLHPFTLFQGDTLLVVEQEAEQDPVRTVVHRYLVDASTCNWVGMS